MKAHKQLDNTYTLEPFKHDCKTCKWIGWITQGEKLGNVYICKGKTVIIRYSDEPSDYWCASVGNSPGAIGPISETEIMKLKTRENLLAR